MGAAMITVRPFEKADIPAVAALEMAGQPQPWTTGILEDELAADNRSYVVAETDVVIGYGGVMVVGEEAHITNLLVAPERRRQGIGRRILTKLVRDAIALGARHLTLEVRGDNEAARRLYHRFGLAPVGIRPGYYQGEDALIMWARDIDKPEYAGSLS
jgi:ribosomal-protein-alanine N-acetyltransferase